MRKKGVQGLPIVWDGEAKKVVTVVGCETPWQMLGDLEDLISIANSISPAGVKYDRAKLLDMCD